MILASEEKTSTFAVYRAILATHPREAQVIHATVYALRRAGFRGEPPRLRILWQKTYRNREEARAAAKRWVREGQR
jgi:hypothetical protein